jgi:hypothetical protein
VNTLCRARSISIKAAHVGVIPWLAGIRIVNSSWRTNWLDQVGPIHWPLWPRVSIG